MLEFSVFHWKETNALWGHLVGPRGKLTRTIQISHPEPPVDRELTPTTQISQNEKVEFSKLSDLPPPYNESYGHNQRNIGSPISPVT